MVARTNLVGEGARSEREDVHGERVLGLERVGRRADRERVPLGALCGAQTHQDCSEWMGKAHRNGGNVQERIIARLVAEARQAHGELGHALAAVAQQPRRDQLYRLVAAHEPDQSVEEPCAGNQWSQNEQSKSAQRTESDWHDHEREEVVRVQAGEEDDGDEQQHVQQLEEVIRSVHRHRSNIVVKST